MPDNHERRRMMPRRVRLASLTLVALLIFLGLASPPPPKAIASGSGDLALYRAIINDVARGQSYAAAAVAEQRAAGYPVRPFVTVRLPTLAVALAALPSETARRAALASLACITLLACAWRARAVLPSPGTAWAWVTIAIFTGVAPAFVASAYALHEVWAGLLITLSLAVYRPGRWGASLALALLAVSIRELAAPFLVVMAALAWREGRKGEAAAWLFGIAALGCGLWLHARRLASLVVASDRAGPGWLALGGWRFVLQTLRMNTVLLVAPVWLAAVAAPLALLGLLSRRGLLSDRIALTILGYCGAFLFIGRFSNAYWGFLLAPVWPLGLVGAASLLRDPRGRCDWAGNDVSGP